MIADSPGTLCIVNERINTDIYHLMTPSSDDMCGDKFIFQHDLKHFTQISVHQELT